MNNTNPLEHPGAVFEMPLMNPNPTSSKTQAGPVYRISFEVPRELWDLFMEADTKGMVIGAHACVGDDGQAPAEPSEQPDDIGELTGGKLAQDLDRHGAWRNPKIWEALCKSQAAKGAYRKWVAMEHPCMICGSEGEDRHPHHWQGLGEGIMGGKVPDHRCVPLCAKHHTGNEGFHIFKGGAKEWLAQMCNAYNYPIGPTILATELMAEFNRAKSKELIGIASMREITPEMLEKLEGELGVKI